MGLLVSFMFPVFYFLINYLDNKLLYKNFIIIASIIFVISISWYVFPIYHYYQIDFESTKFARLSASAMMGSENSNLFMKLDYGLHYLFWKFNLVLATANVDPELHKSSQDRPLHRQSNLLISYSCKVSKLRPLRRQPNVLVSFLVMQASLSLSEGCVKVKTYIQQL